MEEGPAADSDKYPGPRAANAAQRVHYYCGKWPHELLGSFEPATWVERLSDEFATLIRLTVKSQKYELGYIIQKLKDLAREHPYDGAKYVNRQDIATVREWLRKEGIDAFHYRRRSRNSAGYDDDDADDSIVIKSGSEDSVIIAGTPFDSDYSDGGLSDLENPFEMIDSEPGEEASNEHNQISNSQTHSDAATPVRQNTQPVARSVPSEPSSNRVANHHTPASQPVAQPATTPSNNRSSSDRFRPSDVINTHFQESLRRRTMASSVSRRGPSSQSQSASRADRSRPNPSTPVERPNNAAQGGSVAASSPATPSRRANHSPNRRAAPEPRVRVETRQHTTSDRSEVRQPTNNGTQPTNTGSQYGPSTPRPHGQPSSNPIPTPSSTPGTPATSSNDPPSLMRLIDSRSATTTRSQPVIKVEDDTPPPTAPPSHPDRPSNTHRVTSTHAHDAAPPITSRDTGAVNTSTPTRPDAHTSVGSASSGSTRVTNHPHTDTMPPTRHAHALPLSALVNRDVSRKRPMDSDGPITHTNPQQPATSSPLRIAHGTNAAPTEASSSQATPANITTTAMTPTQATPTSRTVMEPNPHLQPTTLRPTSFFSTGPPAWVNEEQSSRPTHNQVPQPSIAAPEQTASPGTVENRPSKRQRPDDSRRPFVSSDEPFNFDATLPDGESFKRQLREWRSWVEPYITDINLQLENIQNEIRALHQTTFTNNSKREATTKRMQEIQVAMQDNHEHVSKTYKIIEVLEPEALVDESTREYLEKRKRQLAEREAAQKSYQEEFSQGQSLLREIEVQQPMIERKLDDFVRDETKITKSKESFDSAMRKWNFQMDLLDGEGGWTKAFERLEANGRAGRRNVFIGFDDGIPR